MAKILFLLTILLLFHLTDPTKTVDYNFLTNCFCTISKIDMYGLLYTQTHAHSSAKICLKRKFKNSHKICGYTQKTTIPVFTRKMSSMMKI